MAARPAPSVPVDPPPLAEPLAASFADRDAVRDPAVVRRTLFDGLTWARLGWVTAISVGIAGAMVWFFHNDFVDLLVSTLCVGYTTMALFTVAGNLPFVQSGRVPREAAQIVAVIAGSALGTLCSGLLKGRSVESLMTERLSQFVATSGLGIGFGCVVVALYFYRERNARMAADLARMAAEFDASRAREDRQLLSARLQLLQAQVEPHFLFNTLANVQHLTTTDPARASDMLGSLIRYLRAALPRMREQASTVGREVEMVRAYLEIQRVRMGDRLAYAIDVEPALCARPMPPMMLISLVENAVKHGIDPSPQGGRIDIAFHRTPTGLALTVVDDGVGLSEHVGLGIGLVNIRERLATLHGDAARLDLHEHVPHGVRASIAWDDAHGD